MFEKRVADERTDIYQFGLTFYLMPTGSNPFDAGSRFDVEERIRSYEPDSRAKATLALCRWMML